MAGSYDAAGPFLEHNQPYKHRMFAVFLPALNFRGNHSPYLWWFYKFVSEFGAHAGFISGDEYYRDPSELLAEGRFEACEATANLYRYNLPDQTGLGKLSLQVIPREVWQAFEARHGANPLAALRHYCQENDPGLRSAMASALDTFGSSHGQPEAVITCVNCATLKNLCHDRGLPLIHFELGPLRPPFFLQTAYFDFSGVNGTTESESRFTSTENGTIRELLASHSVETLRRLFMVQLPKDNGQPVVDLGLGLQIEDDSNIVCYANNHSSISLINHARRLLSQQSIRSPVLVRTHPGSHFLLRGLPAGMEVDRSPSSLDFLMRCKQIITINSGIAVEALLLGRGAIVHGDSPFGYCITPETGRVNASAYAFFLLNYLVPWELAFTPDYIRWRLEKPSEEEILRRHLESHMQEKIRLLELRVAELEKQLSEIQSSWAWRITYPLRALHKVLRRFAGLRSD